MKEHPILFSAPMVRAILDGRKTQTRRVVKPQPQLLTSNLDGPYQWDVKHGSLRGMQGSNMGTFPMQAPYHCPYGRPGDRLWVRETFAIVPRTAYAMSDGVQQVLHPNNNHDAAVFREGWDRSPPSRWRPSIHMPRWASRITLEIVSIRVERLQDISEQDAKAEGAEPAECCDAYYHGFRKLWESINGQESWNANPWVWCIEFQRITP